MANKANKSQPKVSNRKISNTLRQLNNIVGQANLSIYGTDRTSDVDLLNAKFQGILKSEMNSLTNKDDGDVTSFLSQLYSNDKKNNAIAIIPEKKYQLGNPSRFKTKISETKIMALPASGCIRIKKTGIKTIANPII